MTHPAMREEEGHGGQIIRVDPVRDLVVVMAADPNSASAKLSPGLEGLIDVVAAAVRTPWREAGQTSRKGGAFPRPWRRRTDPGGLARKHEKRPGRGIAVGP